MVELGARWEGEFTLGPPTMGLGRLTIPPLITEDQAYLLSLYLMKPYTGQLDPRKEFLSYGMSIYQMVVECTFGHIKVCWKSLGFCF